MPEISWGENQQLIFDAAGNSSDLRLVDSSGETIKENVFASEVTFWNSGNELIDVIPTRLIVRRPLNLQITSPATQEIAES